STKKRDGRNAPDSGADDGQGFRVRDRRWWVNPFDPEAGDADERGVGGAGSAGRGGAGSAGRGGAGSAGRGGAGSAGQGAPNRPAAAASSTTAERAERAALVAQIDTLQAEVTRLEALVAEKDQRARESAVLARQAGDELERAKERIQRESRKELTQKKRSMLLVFLDVLDDLDRAIDAVKGDSSTASDDVVGGIELVRKGFLSRLARLGVTHLPAQGQPFDPDRHEALSLVPVTEPEQDGAVVGVIREGYLIDDETLRPAGVAVGKLAS
ncbi:MAG: nucleotide exchange factor GrpE, partial [Myxococcota bacterium]